MRASLASPGHRVWRAAALVCLAACASGGQAARDTGVADRGTAEPAVLASEAARSRALVARDEGALDTLLAADLSYTHSNANRESKADMLESVRTGRIRYDSLATEGQAVRWVGPAAVVTGRARVLVLVAPAKAPMRITLLYTSIYRRRVAGGSAAGWELVAWQSTRVPEPPPAAAR